ncbi:MAG: hypothetical protein R3F60_26335 [bacterium]
MAPGAEATWRVPEAPLEGWQAVGFDDGAWALGPTGLGYDLAGGPPPPTPRSSWRPAGRRGSPPSWAASPPIWR